MRFLLLFLLLATARGANLVPNSSFEVGAGRSWTYFTTVDQFGDNYARSANVVTNAPQHGNQCWLLTYGSMWGRAMYLTTGVYTVSAYLKLTTGSGTCKLGLSSFDNPNAVMPATPTVTTSWTRVSTNQTVSSNGFYYVQLNQVLANAAGVVTNVYVDAVQCEIGTTASTYAPSNPIECGLETADPDNNLFSGDAKTFRARFWNDSTATTVPLIYQIYDVWNRKMGSATTSVSVATGSSTNTYNLPAGTNGWIRITSRLADRDDSWDELAVAVLPFGTNETVTWLSGHTHYSPYHVQRERRLGFNSVRTLSPASVYRWYNVQLPAIDIEHTEGAFTWTIADAATDSWYTNGLKIVAVLEASGGVAYPPWATNKTITQFLTAWSNYIHEVSARYTNKLYAIELWNEPQLGPTNNPFNIYDTTNYAYMVELAAHVIKLNSPATLVIMGGGWYADAPVYLYAAYTNMSVSAQGKIDAVSTHIYPSDNSDSPNDPNDQKYDSNIKLWMDYWAGVKPVWNTESGIYAAGSLKGLNEFREGYYNIQTTYAVEVSRDKANHRAPISVDRQMNNLIRELGKGFEVYSMYDRRHWHAQEWNADSFNSVDRSGVEEANSVSVLIARNFLAVPGLGQGTNVNVAYNSMEYYRFTNLAGQSVIGIFNSDRTNRVLGVTNSFFAIYDVMGNMRSTNASTNLLVTRTPVYLVSGTLSTTQFRDTLRYATAATFADTNAPSISIDVAPSGNFDAANPMTLVKWTALDRERVVTLTYTNSVLHRWKLDAGSYTDWSQSNHVWIPFTAGDHTFTASAKDESGNTTEEAYKFTLSGFEPAGSSQKSGITGGVSIFGKVDQR